MVHNAKDDPNRTNDFTDTDEPRVTKSSTLHIEPKCADRKTEDELPIRANARRDNDEPK